MRGDSPLGLLAWNGQLLGEDLDPDFAMTNMMLYWVTRTGASGPGSTRGCPRRRAADGADDRAAGPGRLRGRLQGIRRFAERDHRTSSAGRFRHGGHFAAHKAPNELIGDIRAFFTELR